MYTRIPISLLVCEDPLKDDETMPLRTTVLALSKEHPKEGLSAQSVPTAPRTTSNGDSGSLQTRRRWTEEEDEQLRRAVEMFGPRKWGKIAEMLPGRNAQRARMRYNNYARFSKEERCRPFSEADDARILRIGLEVDSSFGAVAKQLGRGNNAIKNRYWLLRRHLER
eukprot:CAMPEP_0185848740 /NCGR_PEP_ID=MMETSP1354-20130828/3499_1 /TAXON_ID=708628 /ORGANISM="Erythrolobus madagascarensis, Strain CCMP3276" /LENGTH=166 /DNA_ID=CAMNT_0028549175 /DNA_START=98 /DNA_END=598 /DNA_ORIENTATION=+